MERKPHCPICGSNLMALSGDKIVCLMRDAKGEYCKGELPARRKTDKLLPILDESWKE